MPAARGRRRASRSAVLWRWRLMLLAAALSAGAAGYVAASAVRPQAESTARLLVGPLGGEDKVLRASGPLAETYARLATTRRMLDATARRLGVGRADVSVRADSNAVTRLLTLRVRAAEGRLATRFANAHASALSRISRRPASGTARAGRLLVVEPAVGAGRSVGMSAAAVAVIAALAGLLIASVLALLFDHTDDAVSSPEDVEAATGMPCVGVLTRGALRGSQATAEHEFGALAAKLGAQGGHSLLLIALHGDPSTVAKSLAAALAGQGARVALAGVGADGPARPPELQLHDLQAGADVVVLHAARLERSPTTLTWARVAGGTVLVAERRRTPANELRTTTDTLRLVGAPIVGTVLADPVGPLGG
jgi:capsular polysaccharide biosynthesis protein